jgi:uncharacterized membrane protein YphA (DoxX/SURF4 family)
MSPRIKTILSWILRGIAAVIMLQTLFFKFTGATESVYIFSKLGVEPWGRIGTGVMELIASVLLLIPRTTVWGALLAMGIMGSALVSHIFFLGIAVQNDGGQLFVYALLVFLCSFILLLLYRKQWMQWIPARFTNAAHSHQ